MRLLWLSAVPAGAFFATGGIPAGSLSHVAATRSPPALSPLAEAAAASRTSNEATTSEDGSWAELKLFSPAKINLFLRIMRKREDGYHELASLFQTVGFGDDLLLARLPDSAEEDAFACDMPGVPVDSSNLVLRALQLFRDKTGATQRFRVRLDKRVPAQAGMGGGSGNAATALFAANEMCGRLATTEQLVEWSAELGSDITFFLSQGTCYCTGRGEILRPVASLPQLPVWLIKPAEGLSTPLVFQNLKYDELLPDDPETLLRSFLEAPAESSSGGCLPGARFVNDLEPPAFRAMPELARMKDHLETFGFDHVLMSGSGSTLFCVGRPGTKAAAAAAAGKWPQEFLERWPGANVCETTFVNRPDATLWYAQEKPFVP